MAADTMRFRRFFSDRHGVATIEFAAILPVLFLIVAGEYAICQAFTVKRKLAMTSRTVADLVAQRTKLSEADITTMMQASTQIMAPHSTDSMTLSVTQIVSDANNKVTIAWSRSLKGPPLGAGSSYSAPPDLMTPNTAQIVVQVEYSYIPLFGLNIVGALFLTSTHYEVPRMVSFIPAPT